MMTNSFSDSRKARAVRTKAQPQSTIVSSTWFDVFGNAHMALEAEVGTDSVLVVAPLELAQEILPIVAIQKIRGRLTMAVLQEMHKAPIQASIDASGAKLVIAVQKNCEAVTLRGPAIATEAFCHLAETGVEYLEEGQYEAWNGVAWNRQNSELFLNPCECVSKVASVAFAQKLQTCVCHPNKLEALLTSLSH